jgi:accessory gene regulator B
MERAAENCTRRLNKYLKKDGLELQKMRFGLEIILINISKFMIIFAVAAAFNLLKEAMFMSIVFASIRRSAFGLHAKNSIVCTLTSLMMFVFGAYLSYRIDLNNYIVFILFTILNILLYKYAPGDTENHPILGAKLRNRLRIQSVIIGVILMVVALVVPKVEVKAFIVLATSFEVISILPLTYRILNRGYKNYEKYEGAVM